MMNLSLGDLQSLPPNEFERLVARLLEAHGFRNVLPLGASGDEGIDIRAEWVEELPTGDTRTTLCAVQCKRYSSSISPKETKQILDAARLPNPDFFPTPPDFFLLATSSQLTKQAKSVIERANKDRAT